MLLGARSYRNAFFGPGTGPVYLDDFFCTGNENRLIDCRNGGINMIDFCRGHLDDAGVRCAESKLTCSIKQAHTNILLLLEENMYRL